MGARPPPPPVTAHATHARNVGGRQVREETSGAAPRACPKEQEQADTGADDAEAEAEAVAIDGQQASFSRPSYSSSSPSSSSSPNMEKESSESHAEREDDEVAALLRASPAEPLRVSVYAVVKLGAVSVLNLVSQAKVSATLLVYPAIRSDDMTQISAIPC